MVRMPTGDGAIKTIVGPGERGSSGDGGPAMNAKLEGFTWLRRASGG